VGTGRERAMGRGEERRGGGAQEWGAVEARWVAKGEEGQNTAVVHELCSPDLTQISRREGKR
jgi:hypothetical protein